MKGLVNAALLLPRARAAHRYYFYILSVLGLNLPPTPLRQKVLPPKLPRVTVIFAIGQLSSYFKIHTSMCFLSSVIKGYLNLYHGKVLIPATKEVLTFAITLKKFQAPLML